MENVNVREILESNQAKMKRNFLMRQECDREAAMKRMIASEQMYAEWFTKVNSANNRGLPEELVSVYEEAANCICNCIMMERKIVNGEHLREV